MTPGNPIVNKTVTSFSLELDKRAIYYSFDEHFNIFNISAITLT